MKLRELLLMLPALVLYVASFAMIAINPWAMAACILGALANFIAAGALIDAKRRFAQETG